MPQHFEFVRNTVFAEYTVEGTPTIVEIPLHDIHSGRGFTRFTYIAQIRAPNGQERPGRFIADLRRAVLTATPESGALAPGDTITVIGRYA